MITDNRDDVSIVVTYMVCMSIVNSDQFELQTTSELFFRHFVHYILYKMNKDFSIDKNQMK